jgi:hypothetical protein
LEVGGGDAAHDHALEAAEVVEAVVGRGLDGREQGLAGILAGHAQELAQGQRRLELPAVLEGAEVGVDLGQQAEQVLLFGERLAIAPAPALAAGGADAPAGTGSG